MISVLYICCLEDSTSQGEHPPTWLPPFIHLSSSTDLSSSLFLSTIRAEVLSCYQHSYLHRYLYDAKSQVLRGSCFLSFSLSLSLSPVFYLPTHQTSPFPLRELHGTENTRMKNAWAATRSLVLKLLSGCKDTTMGATDDKQNLTCSPWNPFLYYAS